jgi:hypothetical protein
MLAQQGVSLTPGFLITCFKETQINFDQLLSIKSVYELGTIISTT